MGNESNNGKVPLISKIAYGFGDVGCNFSWMFVSNFLMIFYTDVFGISMAAVSALMLFSRFWYAINDPIVGGLTDKTHTRWGRYRPWPVSYTHLDVYKRQDAYCAASALTDEKCQTLEQFMKSLENKEPKAEDLWQEYLKNLAILISNLRMAYDMDIILGGEVGGYLTEYMIPLGEKVMEYNGFDHDVRYLKMFSYKREASAVGAAKHFLQEFIKNM